MDLRVFAGLDGTKFTAGLTSLKQAVNSFGRQTFGGIQSQIAGAFTVGALVAFSKKTIDFAGNMRDLADRLSVNVEWLQKMNNAARQAGSSAEDLANFMNEVGRSRQEAVLDPKSKAAKSFERMGFSSGDMTGLSQQSFVEKLVKAFAGGATVQMENDAAEVGGKSAKKLLATFKNGIENSGPIIPEEMINQLDDLGDAFYILQQGLMADLAPALTSILKFVQDFVDSVKLVGAILGGALGGLGTEVGWEKSAQAASDAYAQEVLAREQRAKDERARGQANRRTRENSPPQFDTTDAKNPAVKAAKIATDSLLSVGNFLGSTRGNIESISKETNRILREHSGYLRTIANGKSNNLTIGVP